MKEKIKMRNAVGFVEDVELGSPRMHELVIVEGIRQQNEQYKKQEELLKKQIKILYDRLVVEIAVFENKTTDTARLMIANWLQDDLEFISEE